MGLFDIFRIDKIKKENEAMRQKLQELHADEYFQVKKSLDSMNADIEHNSATLSKLQSEVNDLSEKSQKLEKQVNTQKNKVSRYKELYKSIEYAITNFLDLEVPYENCRLNRVDFDEMELVSPSIMLKLHSMDMRDLRNAYKANERQITELLKQYSSRYTTKANKSIYDLMVIALRSELQNILYNLKYERLDQSVDAVKKVSAKYLKIASEGNKNIAGTMTKFIGEIEYLFINAVKIEYNYYVKKEQAKQEQLAIREQMRQEAKEQKELEAERKKIEQEEQKYAAEIEKLKIQTSEARDDEVEKYKERILALENQLSAVVIQKKEISTLQNGKAGRVYIISNLGSFGENIFKIGMTRRREVQERVDELGDASVPFKFDIHSTIFSNDAVELEKSIHQKLNSKRVNKVNLRKEFFYSSIDELEELVASIDPTAEFKRTMLAEEYRQSLSSDDVYTTDVHIDIPDSDDE